MLLAALELPVRRALTRRDLKRRIQFIEKSLQGRAGHHPLPQQQANGNCRLERGVPQETEWTQCDRDQSSGEPETITISPRFCTLII